MYKDIPLNEEEQREAAMAADMLRDVFNACQFPPEVGQTLKLAFAKAAINPQDVPHGSWHRLADGEPFYRFTLSAEGKSKEQMGKDPSLTVLWYLWQELMISFQPGGTPQIMQDFRKPIAERARDIALAAVNVAPYVRRELFPQDPQP